MEIFEDAGVEKEKRVYPAKRVFLLLLALPMTSIRRAFVMSSIEQYLALGINVTVVATMARVLTPDEVGHAVTGLGISAIALSLREFVTPEYLIQKAEIDEGDVRTSFTLLAGITLLVSIGVMAISGQISLFYDAPELPLFLFLVLMSAGAEIISLPIVAVLRREMSFGTLAKIRTIALAISAVVTILLSFLGFGYISYAWGMLASAVALAGMTGFVTSYRVTTMCRPSLIGWQQVVSFGRFKGASQAVDRIYETVPQLILGKIISMSSVGLYNRANTVCAIPDRLIMSAFYAMAFPALAASVRDGRNIKKAYLGTLSYLSGIYWPGVLLISLTADPIVNLVLGDRWHEAIPLVRVMAGASVFWFAVIVINPLLLALGHNRDAFLSGAICRCFAGIMLCGASTHGVMAMALSQFVVMPVQMVISLYFAKRHLHYTLGELWGALLPSIVVTVFSLVGPIALLAADGWNPDTGLSIMALTLLLAGAGWLAGLFVANHPFLTEVRWFWSVFLSLTPLLVRKILTQRG